MGGQVFANSRDVADFFGKRHADVLRDVDNTLKNIDNANLRSGWFHEVSYRVDGQERDYRTFDMTRDGFTLLVMGYTGPKAMQFKVRYIQRFNEMEEALKAAVPNFSNPAEAARAWADQYEQRQLAELRVKKISKEKERLAAEKKVAEIELEAADQEIGRMGSVIGAHLHTVARFARTIPGVNTNAVKKDLFRAGYLYKATGSNVYRVYRKFSDYFIEKIEETYGKVDIFVTEEGKRLLLRLNAEGKLTRLKGR